MGKNLVPRFKCPLCGWLAYYTMLDRGPYKIEIKGMKYSGFQEITYHRVWTGRKKYKEFLRLKVRELAKRLGLKLADEEEDITDEYDEEIEVESTGVGMESPLEQVVEKPSRRVMEIPTEMVETISAEYTDSVRRRSPPIYKEFLAAYVKAIEEDRVMVLDSDGFAIAIDHESIDVGGDK